MVVAHVLTGGIRKAESGRADAAISHRRRTAGFPGRLFCVWPWNSSFWKLAGCSIRIADKLLVSACLLMLAADGTIRGWLLGGDRILAEVLYRARANISRNFGRPALR